MNLKICLICRYELYNIPNLICGHFICPDCYCKLKNKNSKCKCPFCDKTLRRRW